MPNATKPYKTSIPPKRSLRPRWRRLPRTPWWCAAADFYCRTRKSALAEVQLNRIIGGKLGSPEADIFWARRELALIVANRGGYQNFQRARELIDKNLATAEASVLDRLARAIIDISDPLVDAAKREFTC